MRERLEDKTSANGWFPEEAIDFEVLKRRSDHHDDVEHSTFFVSHWTYHRICRRQKDKLVVERGPRDWRMLYLTPYGIVYIEPDGTLQNEQHDDSGPIEVERGDISYERCIEIGELWMKRADERKPDHK